MAVNTHLQAVIPLIVMGMLVVLALQSAADPTPAHRLTQALDLTSEQQESVAAVFEARKSTRMATKEQFDEVRSLIAAGEVEAAADLAAQQARERVYSMAELRSELVEILTPEQLEQLDTLRAERAMGGAGPWGRKR